MLADDRKLDTLKPHGVTVTAKMGRTEVGQLRAEPLSQSQWNSANIDTVKYVCVWQFDGPYFKPSLPVT